MLTHGGSLSAHLKTQAPHLHVQAEERVVSKEAVAARGCNHVACERHVTVWVLCFEQGGRPVHHFIHVAAHTIQRQVVCHLHRTP